MDSLKSALNMIPPGADLVIVGALIAFGIKTKTVQWIALGVGGAQLFLAMQSKGV